MARCGADCATGTTNRSAGFPVAELNGHRNLVDKLEDWTSIESVLEARAAKDALEYDRQRQGIRALLEIGEERVELG
jgi:hypothetical protein